MKRRLIVKLLRRIKPESRAHVSARLRREFKSLAISGSVSNWLIQGSTGSMGQNYDR